MKGVVEAFLKAASELNGEFPGALAQARRVLKENMI